MGVTIEQAAELLQPYLFPDAGMKDSAPVGSLAP
jgi:hypothetical protein